MSGAQFSDFIQYIAVAAIPILFGITFHEVAHGWMARRHGDRTAEMLGRLSLNPLKHIDPVGTVVVPLLLALTVGFMFGWAKPVPINPGGLRNPKKDMIAVAIAGPAANFGMALIWAFVFHTLRTLGVSNTGAAGFFLVMASFGVFFNILLGIFNLLPVPPLDGGRVLRGVVSEALAVRLDAIERYGLIIVVALIYFGLLGPIIGFVNFLMRFLGVSP